MKKISTFLSASLLLIATGLRGQSINLDPVNGLYCPGQTYTFTVTIPVGAVWSTLSVSGTTLSLTSNGATFNSKPANVYSQPANITYPNGNTTQFIFTGGFQDDNTPQSFQVYYVVNGTNNFANFTYYKIESFLNNRPLNARPAPPFSAVTVPRCQTGSFNVSFPNVQMNNNIPVNPSVYGTVSQYQYLIPAGWSIGTTSSDGSAWITSTNNVSVTPGLDNGDGGFIYIRAVNPCSGSLTVGPTAQIAISRPAPSLSITASDNLNTLCSGSKTYTINGVPAGGTVLWSIDNTAIATIPPNSSGLTVAVTAVGSSGTARLTATVNQCSFAYSVNSVILVGPPGTGVIGQITNANYCQDWGFQVLPTNGGFYTYSATVRIVPGTGVATAYTWSVVAPNNFVNWIDNGDGSVVVSSKQSNEHIGLSIRLRNGCGFSTKNYMFTTGNCPISVREITPPAFSIPNSFDSSVRSGLEDPAKELILAVFPNPIQNVLNITLPLNTDLKRTAIRVMNMYGRPVIRLQSVSNINRIPCSDFPSGIYIVEIKTGTKPAITRKLVKI